MLGSPAPTPFDPTVLWRYPDLRARGVDPQRTAGWTRVRRGVWVFATVWAALTPEQQHAARVHASAWVCDSGESAIFAHESAAAVWGLPRIEPWPPQVRTLLTSGRVRSSPGLRPVRGVEVTPVLVNGIRVTPVARTIADIARSGSLVTAVAAADHALRHQLCTRAELAEEADAVPSRARGRPQVAVVVELADPEAMSAGESLSRVQMFRLGLPRPMLQVAHRDDQGLIGLVDFDWDGVVGEFDGKVKYRAPTGADARAVSEVLWQEKKREDRLRVRSRVARWTWDVALDKDRLGAVLAVQGVRPDPRVSWFDLGPKRSA